MVQHPDWRLAHKLPEPLPEKSHLCCGGEPSLNFSKLRHRHGVCLGNLTSCSAAGYASTIPMHRAPRGPVRSSYMLGVSYATPYDDKISLDAAQCCYLR